MLKWYSKKYVTIIEDLYRISYNDERKYFDKIVSLWVYYVTRPVSIFITPFFIFFKINANLVTIIGFIIGIGSLISSYLSNFLSSALLYNLFLIFDSIDGNISRLTTPTKKGEYIDSVSGDIINFLFLPFIGLGLYRKGEIFSYFGLLFVDNIISITLVISLIHVLSVLISQRKKMIFNKRANEPTRIGSKTRVSIFEYIIRNSFGFAFNAPFSILFAYLELLDLFILYNLMIMPMVLLATIFRK